MPLTIPDDLTQPYTRYGITIGRLKANELEELRARRNDPEIANVMISRDHITPEAQLAWYERVNNRQNLYGTLSWQGQFIGITNIRSIDAATCSGEGGMVIWSKEAQTSSVPFRAAVVGTDLAFWVYGFERIEAQIIATNVRAVRFNRALGYEFAQKPDERGVLRGSLVPARYWPRAAPLRALFEQEDALR